MARYAGAMTGETCPRPWFAVEALWIMKRVEVNGLVFEPGDRLVEYFSPAHWFNAFRVMAPDGVIRGVYGNVTCPVAVDVVDDETIVTWHDLYLDVLRLGDGSLVLCDDVELAASGLAVTNPELHERIMTTAAEMMVLARTGTFPFHFPDD